MSATPYVAHLNLASGFRGGERQTLALIEALAGTLRQRAIVRRGGELAEQLADVDVELIAVSGTPISAVRATAGCDLLHVHEGRSVQTAALRRLVSRTPFIVTRRIPQRPSATALWCYRQAHTVVSVSAAIGKVLTACDKRIRPVTVPDCVPPLSADPAVAARLRGDTELVVGQCGELHDAHKGQRLTIEVARRMAETHPQVEFWLIGQGRDEQDLRAAAAGLQNVRFVGWTDNVADYYAAMDVMVYPSRYEGLGSAILEAMLFGVPVVAARVGGIPEIVVHEENGLLFAPGDADDFVTRLTALVENPALRERLGAAARQQAARHTPEVMAGQYRDIYAQILGHAA
ncbi:MAG: glycosyltransferase family 4 protein [Gammaproteobacteria bacterium]|nr:glycosyltransferase family 4 protein [Gammaproteobacteria bacterium]NNM20901.1 glycosyltransferase family 4 protein [Gammaproteobacteria bacterium]